MRLIDADALLEGRQDHEMISTHLIWNAPTVEAEPVRHGRWITEGEFESFDATRCSECECSEYFNKGWKRYNYCPTCGALMDGGDE